MKKLALVWLLLLLVVPLQGLRGWAGDSAPQSQASGPLDEFSVAGNGDALLLPVTFQGKTYKFIIDTGSTLTMFDKSLTPMLGKSIRSEDAETPDGTSQFELFNAPAATVGKIPFQTGQPVAAMDMSKIQEASELSVSGVLGMDFLRRHVVRIDFDRGRLSFLPSAGPDAGEALDLSYNDLDLPCVQADLPVWGAEPFVVDTGTIALNGCLGPLPLKSLETSGRLRLSGEGREVTTALGKSVSRQWQVESFELGKFSHRGLKMNQAGRSVLGLGYWSRYTVTFDFPDQKVYLKPGKRFSSPDKEDMSGLQWERQHGDTVITSVGQGSPAESAGVKAGDVIIAVGSKKAGEMRLFDLWSLLCENGRKVQMRLRRGEKEMDASFVLAAWQTQK